MKNRSAFTLAVFLAALLGLGARSAQAVNNTWDGGGGNGNWDNITNWVLESSIPTGTQIATFNNAVNTAISLNGSNRSVGQMLFNNAATGSYTFSGTGTEGFQLSGASSQISITAGTTLNPVITFNVPISLGGNVVFSNGNTGSSAALIFNGDITNTSSATLTLAGSTTSVLNKISGDITEGTGALGVSVTSNAAAGQWELAGSNAFSGTLAKSGASTLVLSGSNSYTGVTAVSGGVLNVRNSYALGSTAGDTTVASGAALQLQDGVSVSGETLTLNGTGVSTTGALRNISGTNTYGGPVVLAGATRINSDAGLLVLNTGTISGATFGLTIGGAGNTTISSSIGTTTGGVTKDGNGALTLSGNNTFTGSTALSAGTLNVNSAGALGGGTLVLTGGTLNNTSGAAITNTGNNDVVWGGNMVFGTAASGSNNNLNLGSGNVSVFNSNRTLTFAGSNSTLTMGALVLTSTASRAYTVNGAGNTLVLGGMTINVTGTSTSIVTLQGDANISILGAIVDGSTLNGLTNSNTGIVTLAGNNTYTGTTTINAGAVLSVSSLANGGTTSGIGASSSISSNLVLSNGTLRYTGSSVSTDRSFQTGGTASTIDVTNAATTLTISGSTSISSGNLTKSGAGTLLLTGSTRYTGATIISGGALAISGTHAIGSTSQVRIADSASLIYTGVSSTLAKNIFVTSGTGTVSNTGGNVLSLSGTLNKDGTALRLTGGSINVSGPIVGASANSDLLVDAATVTLTGSNSYNGPTYLLNSGTLNANAANALPTANGRTAVIMDQTGGGNSHLALSVSQSVASLQGAASSSVNLNASTLTLGTASGTTTFAGSISGAGGTLVKDGNSVQVLSGNNSYTGATQVNVGTLLVNGSLAADSDVTVSATGILGGTGTIGGDTTLEAGARLSPGDNSASLLTFSGNLNLTGGLDGSGALVFTLGSASDQIAVGGTLAIGSGLLSFADFAFTAGTGFGNGTYVLFDNANSISGTLAGSGLSGTVGGLSSTLSLSGNDLILTVVPEPSVCVLVGAGLGLILIFRRRRSVLCPPKA
ncbi:MAG TPA: autotransporter-associated beta strand repeat-containing protein [Terrimicrobiaceae bacterium]|nr:autotransporter-associated beta strand repeat-containing protein [Terrimicrobiaceae bacterium]